MRVVVSDEIELSVVVPTLNEASNLPFLVQRIGAALKGRSYEVLVIDDGSTDNTPDVCAQLRERYPIFLHVRPDAKDGLSGAVVYGLSRAQGEYLVVMDADLQHPPEQIPELIEPLERDEAEFVIGSRYVKGGSTDRRWGPLRKANSGLATVLSRPLTGSTRDPMSGFFALRAETYLRADELSPVGYKIALELLCKCRIRRIREVPILFGIRQTGLSKLTVKQRLQFLSHLSRLYDYSYPQSSSAIKSAIVNLCMWMLSFGLYVRLVARDVNPGLAPAIAFTAAIGVSAIFQLQGTRSRQSSGRAWIDFALIAMGQWSACTLSARWIANHAIHATVVEVFALTSSIAVIAGYVIKKQLTHRAHPTAAHALRTSTRRSEFAMRSAA